MIFSVVKKLSSHIGLIWSVTETVCALISWSRMHITRWNLWLAGCTQLPQVREHRRFYQSPRKQSHVYDALGWFTESTNHWIYQRLLLIKFNLWKGFVWGTSSKYWTLTRCFVLCLWSKQHLLYCFWIRITTVNSFQNVLVFSVKAAYRERWATI